MQKLLILSSNLSKLIEKLVHEWLHLFLEMKSVIYKQQYGFRNKHSTTHALIDITENVTGNKQLWVRNYMHVVCLLTFKRHLTQSIRKFLSANYNITD